MISTATELVDALTTRVPKLKDLYDEHLDFNDELLPSVYFGELVPLLVDDFEATGAEGAEEPPWWRAVLDILEREYHGSLAVEELIDFSFLEELPYPEERGYGIVDHLGPTLREALPRVASRPETATDGEEPAE